MVRTIVRSDATWVDVSPLPEGGVAVALATLEGLEVRKIDGFGDRVLWRLNVEPGAFGFLRAAADSLGRVACIGQGQNGYAYLTRQGAALEAVGLTFGVFCVEIRGLYDGWELAILRNGHYELLTVPVAGPIVARVAMSTPTTQGFIQADGPEGVVLQDDGRLAVPGLVLAEFAAGPVAAAYQRGLEAYYAGQNGDEGPDRIRLTDGARFAAVIEEYAQPPHAIRALDGSIWVATWAASGAFVAGYPTPEDVPWGNDAGDGPPPPDIVAPKITIAEYSPASGAAPLTVRAVAAIDPASGPIDELRWLSRPAGSELWTRAATNPPTDLDHSYRFEQPGRYDLALEAAGPGGTDRTGNPRTVEATGAIEPPDPPDPPDPEPTGVLTAFVCQDGDHYLCADLGVDDTGGQCRLVADRLEQGGYETFEVIDRGSGKVAIRARTNGRYWHAADGGGGGVYADRDAIGEHEEFTLEAQDDGVSVAIRTAGGQYLCAENGGGGLVAANRDTVGPWERFVPTEELRPPTPTAGRALEGRIRWIDGRGLADDLGLFVPVFYHHGDAGLVWTRNPDDVRRVLDVTQPRGLHGFRAWMGRLLPSYWDDYILTDQAFVAFQRELKDRNLRLMWDGGDLGRASREERQIVQSILLNLGDRDVLASVSMCNEGNDNSDMSPEEMADWLAPIAEKWPDLPIWCTTGGAGHEDTAHGATTNPNYDPHKDMDRWNPAPSRLVGKHGYRDGSIVDKARHCFSFVYEGQPKAWVTVDDEPPGPGQFVSVISNREQLTPEGVSTIFLTAAIAGQWWVFFPGIEQATDPIDTFIPHLERLVAQAAQLPADLFAFEDLEHGGSSQGNRVWEVTDSPGPETARCDHALADDGRFVCSCYDDAGRQNFRQIKGTETQPRIENAPWGFVSIGQQ
jgi:hypothetical protein